MQFPNYVGPQFSDNDLEKNNWIPINAKSIYCDKLLTEIFGHDGVNNYMHQNLDMKG